MQMPKWRNVQLFRTSLAVSSSTASQIIACFHSTPSFCEKWGNKWNSDVNKGQEPSKNHIRYVTHHKRADTKKALKNLLYNSGSSKFSFQNKNMRSSWSAVQEEHSNCFDKKFQPRSSARFTGKSNSKKIKRKFKRDSFTEDFDDQPETIFHAAFANRSYTWSFATRDESFRSSSSEFEWRDHSNCKNSRANKWHEDSNWKSEFNGESCVDGSSSDRTILGLPPRGPLKIEEVKKAFHLSALKWHPDKHQQPSQAMAEEKFKLCVNAYRSLCTALSPAR